ncbi:nad-dependent epimerase dehydratase [Seminavis robusta]|uniref:Nad-dependent epimerase dehydratase n=1 Tax=Seminavis robusta TaxID=568900 RepID=A0A9N8HIY1_9STRA|nr:nad-dependent epimerase dehydratase [Seminavis robusta]|eukprot:Sro728_g193680.1 nad-dependent epimerase dehydratase (235) ;mRNA; f:16330-17034
MTTGNKSVLIIGATGALGLQLLRHLAKNSSIGEVHVMARTPSKLESADRALAASVQKGNARDANDVETALRNSKANYVILATGNGHDVSKSDTREATGRALALVLKKPEFSNIQAVVMSSHGVAETNVIIGFGLGMLLAYYLRHVFVDHEKQEAEFDSLTERTLVVRPSGLSDDKAIENLDYIVEFDGIKKGPSINIDRSDVAAWVTREIASSKAFIGGRKVCLTNAKNLPKKV